MPPLLSVPYCVKLQGTSQPHPPAHPPPVWPSLLLLPSLAWKIPHEPLFWCKSQVGGNVSPADAPALCREISVDTTDGRFQKKTECEQERRKRAIKRERGQKRARCEQTWACHGVTFDFLTFSLAVLSSSPGWWTELSGLFSHTLSLRFGMCNDFFNPLFPMLTQRSYLFLLVLKKHL